MSGTERDGRGVFDCPVNSCDSVIIGSYTDLLEHVRDHPLAKLVVEEDGTNLLEQIRDARSDALAKDIQRHFCVDAEETQ